MLADKHNRTDARAVRPTIIYKNMKRVYKSDLARAAGVSEQTMRRWCREHQENLSRLFTPPRAKILHPLAVRYLCEHYCIELPEK